MGGFGTFRLLARWPDLFSRGFSVVGAPGSSADQLASLRNTQMMSWNSTEDELVNLSDIRRTVAGMTAAGIRFDERLFLTADHLTLASNDEYAPGAAFLGSARVDRDPAHVTYVVDPSEDNATARTVADHAYWVSGLRAAEAGTTGTFDVVSQASGLRDGAVLPVSAGGGVLTGGHLPALSYASQTRGWRPATRTTASDALVVRSTGVRAATLDARRAGRRPARHPHRRPARAHALRHHAHLPVAPRRRPCGRLAR